MQFLEVQTSLSLSILGDHVESHTYLCSSSPLYYSHPPSLSNQTSSSGVWSRVTTDSPPKQTPSIRRRYSDPDLDSKIQFTLEHAFGDSDFSSAGTFSARLKTWSHGGQVYSLFTFIDRSIVDIFNYIEREFRESEILVKNSN